MSGMCEHFTIALTHGCVWHFPSNLTSHFIGTLHLQNYYTMLIEKLETKKYY